LLAKNIADSEILGSYTKIVLQFMLKIQKYSNVILVLLIMGTGFNTLILNCLVLLDKPSDYWEFHTELLMKVK
jgi:hypothetical protein